MVAKREMPLVETTAYLRVATTEMPLVELVSVPVMVPELVVV